MKKLKRLLTKRVIDSLPVPELTPAFEWDGSDGSVKGFGCKSYPSGRKVFVFQYDDAARRTHRVTIGAYGTFTVDQARERARQMAANAVTARTNPEVLDAAAAKSEARRRAIARAEAPTMADLFDAFLKDRELNGAKRKTLDEYRRLLGITTIKKGPKAGIQRAGVMRAAFGSKRVADLDRRGVKTFHEAHSGTPAMANRCVDLLSACLAFAEAEGLCTPRSNPCPSIKRYKLHPKRQMLAEADYRALGAALDAASRDGVPADPKRMGRSRGMSRTRRAKLTGRKRGPYRERKASALRRQNPFALTMIRVIALTGMRSIEAYELRWADVDLDRGIIVLPDSKTGRSPRAIGRAAIDVLKALRELEAYPADHPYVFPGTKPGEPLREIDHVWAAVRHAAGLGQKVTLHGLRHAFTSTARWLGYNDHFIAHMVGHTVNSTQTSRYGDVPDGLVREAADRVSREIAGYLATGGRAQELTERNVASETAAATR